MQIVETARPVSVTRGTPQWYFCPISLVTEEGMIKNENGLNLGMKGAGKPGGPKLVITRSGVPKGSRAIAKPELAN